MNEDRTIAGGPSEDRTEVASGMGMDKPTEVTIPTSGGGDRTRPVSAPADDASGESERTMIFRPKPTTDDSSSDAPGSQEMPADRRRLEGWLVSYTLDPAGVDFRVVEGQNIIGRGQECHIRIHQDPKISSTHAILFFRGGKVVLSDELSSNPTFIDGDELGPGERMPVPDGAEISMGDHKFFFRKANP